MGTQSHYPVSLPSFSEEILSRLLSNGSLSGGPFPLPNDSPSCATSHMRDSEIVRKKQKNVCAQGESSRHDTTVSTLPDNVLLEIFDLERERYSDLYVVWDWHILAHVCQRWRQIIFDSPNSLNLRIFCTYGTPVRKDLWYLASPSYRYILCESHLLDGRPA
ncbi:hypothetical protein EDB89DRAFT_1962744 [Lactarius sanguifluus]|nr:hypothetical protein EDB89DRAFT_1962744 [Lactarius sanguifluus]